MVKELCDPAGTALRALNVGTMWTEMMAASAYVIGRRAGILYGAAENPLDADLAEIGRMLPEKADALWRGVSDMGRANGPVEAAERLLAPVHERATANAKRLRKGRRD